MLKPIVFAAITATATATSAVAQPPRPADQARSVTLSLAEYNRLLDLERRAPASAAPAPVAAVVSSVDLRLVVNGDTARGTLSLAGQVLHTGINRVPLVNGAALADVTSGGRPVPLVTEGQWLQALVNGPGAFSISAEWRGPLSYRPGRASFVVPVPQAGAARAPIDLPGEQADVRLSSGLVTRRTTTNGRTIVEATLDPGAATEVWWSMRDSAPVAAVKDLRALADVMTLITLDDSDVRMAALIDVNVTQGEFRTLKVRLPHGYEYQNTVGSTLEESTATGRDLILTVGNPAARSHQFLITLERAHAGSSFSLETEIVSIADIQRERGEIAIEGLGTMDLTTADRDGLHRIDVRELNPSLQALARLPILSAFRYQRPSGTTLPQLPLEVKRFADAGVLAAAADRAIATTLVTTEGRALTEVQLEMRNRSQPFLKVELPAGATIVSVDLSGQSAKPASGPDGTRIPLMRAGLSYDQPYPVSFVYVHAGTPFQKKGDIEMTLPKMDVPIGVVQWEVFVPEQYTARSIDGNMIDASRFDAQPDRAGYEPTAYSSPLRRPAKVLSSTGVAPGQLRGRVTDGSSGVPGATVRLAVGGYERSVVSDGNGEFAFFDVPRGQVTLTSELAGFRTSVVSMSSDGTPRRIEIEMALSTISETVTVSAESKVVDVQRQTPPSQNVVNLQARAAGVLPIRVDVPRAGVSHEFIKPLVISTQPTVKLRYKRK